MMRHRTHRLAIVTTAAAAGASLLIPAPGRAPERHDQPAVTHVVVGDRPGLSFTGYVKKAELGKLKGELVVAPGAEASPTRRLL
jgi:hypothetical protein